MNTAPSDQWNELLLCCGVMLDIYSLSIYNTYIDRLYMEARMELDRSLVSGSMALLVMKLLKDGDMYGYQMTEELL